MTDRGDPGDGPGRFAEQLFDAWSNLDALSDRAVPPRPLTMQDLYAYATDPEAILATEQADLLARDPTLRAGLHRLLANTAELAVPRLAAAASFGRAGAGSQGGGSEGGGSEGGGRLMERRMAGCTVRFRESRMDARQVYVIVEFADPAASPDLLVASGPAGIEKQALPPAGGGRVQVLLDADAPLLALLADPETELFFL